MTHLTKLVENEVEQFLKKFKKKKFVLESKHGKITSIESNDKEIIQYAKTLGLKSKWS